MEGIIHINGIIGEDETLSSVISKVKALEDPSSIVVNIDSPGGSVEVGESIYNYLAKLNEDGIPVTTIAKRAYSIAAQIFMAGSKRLVESDQKKPLMIHLPLVAGFTGTSEDFDFVSAELKKIEKRFKSFYSALLDLPEDTIEDLLKNETFLSPEESVSMGFATGYREKVEAVAFFSGPKTSEQSKLNIKMNEILKAIALKLGVITETKALLVTAGDGETEIDFYELEEGDTPEVGSKARIGGADADGSYIMPSGETYVFTEGELSEIQPKDEEEDEEGDETEGAEGNAEPAAEMVKQVTTWQMEVNESNIQEGTALTYTYDEETYPLSAGEFILEDGRTVVTDASGVVVKVKGSEGGTEEGSEGGTEARAEEDVVAKVVEALNAKLEAAEAKIQKLEAAALSPGLDEETEKPFEAMSRLEQRRYNRKNSIK